MDDPAVRLRLLVEDEELLVRITPVTPHMIVRTPVLPHIVGASSSTTTAACARKSRHRRRYRRWIETERRLDAFSAKRWDAVRRPAPPRVKTEAERRLDSFNDEHWDAWRARTTAKPRPLSTHSGNEVWRRDAHAPPPRGAGTRLRRASARPVRPAFPDRRRAARGSGAASAAARGAFATRPTPVEQGLGPAFNTSGRNWAPHAPRSRPHLAEPNMVRRVARAWEQMDI